jgi:hypothetical protein
MLPSGGFEVKQIVEDAAIDAGAAVQCYADLNRLVLVLALAQNNTRELANSDRQPTNRELRALHEANNAKSNRRSLTPFGMTAAVRGAVEG